MHAMRKLMLVAVVAGAATLVAAPSATAGDGAGGPADGGVTPQPDGYLGRVRSQVNELNRYVSNPQPCYWGPATEPNPYGVIEGSTFGDGHLPEPLAPGYHNGYWRYRLLREVGPDDPSVWAEGMQYVRECYWGQSIDTVEEDGPWQEGWQGVTIFDAVNPENLARLALDQFFLGLPAPRPTFSPASPTMVNFDTWLWVGGDADDIPTGEISSEVISVPGLDSPGVQAFARVGEVRWDMGDGSRTCPVTRSADDAQALDCIYEYDRSSADQPDNVYQGSATLVWEGRYTINGAPGPALPNIERETPFELAVEEAQALNTDD